MNGNCHLAVGTCVGTALALNLDKVNTLLPSIENSPSQFVLLILGGMVGGLFADIDNPKSHIGQLTTPISNFIGGLGFMFGKSGSNHRGVFHDIGLFTLLAIFCYFYCPSLIGFMLGYLTHLLLDALNPSGVPIFLISKIHLLPYGHSIPSNSKTASVISYIFALTSLGLGVFMKVGLD